MAAEPSPARADPDRPVLPTDAQRRALRFLESVYKKAVVFDSGKSLKGWIRPEEGSSEHRTARDYVLQEVLKDWTKAGEAPAERVSEVGDRRAFYRRQTDLATPLIATSAREWMRGTLDTQQVKLSDVMVRALRSSKGANTAAVEVVEDAKNRLVSIRDPDSWAVMYPANFSWPRDGDTMTRVKKLQYIAIVRDRLEQLTTPSPQLGRATDRGITRVEGFELGNLATRRVAVTSQTVDRPTWLIEGYELLRLLLWHPRGAELVNAFQRSGLSGTQHATAAVRDSLIACATARSTIDDDLSRVWRISPAVAAGVAKLGSSDPISLTSYALAWAATEKTFIEKGIAFLSDVTAAIGLFGGPAGEVVEAIADVILSGASTAVSFLKQQEQEQAFLATALEKESERLSSGGRYASTVLEGAAALVAAVALPGAVQSVTRRATRATTRAAKQPARATPSASPTRSRDIARGTVTSDAGQEATRGTGIRGKATEDVFEAASPGRKRAQNLGSATSSRTGPSATRAGQRSAAGAAASGRTTTAAASHGSGVGDTSFPLTPRQRGFPSRVLTVETEKAVGKKLERETGLKIADPERAMPLRQQVHPPMVKSQPITDPVLLKEPVVTDPRFPAGRNLLGSAKPDYLYMTPTKIEVFEVTVDARFSIVPQELGMSITGSAVRAGDPHKRIQVRKTLDYLIRRYPDQAIVYNIQTIGEITDEVRGILQTELAVARRLLAAEGGKGSVEIVVRAAQTFSIN